MKNIILYFLLAVLVVEVTTLYIIKIPKDANGVLGNNVELTYLPTPSSSPEETYSPIPSLSPSPIKTPTPTPTKAPTPVPQPTYSSQQINEFIVRFAAQYGVSPDILRYVALCESGFNSQAKNGGYSGLFQFNSTTWKNLRTKMGEDINVDLRTNAEEAVQTAAYAISIGDTGIWPNCYP